MIGPRLALVATGTLLLTGCGDAPDPDDYGGGALGEGIAQCIVAVEDAHERYTRPHSEALCVCVHDDLGRTTEEIVSDGVLDRSVSDRLLEQCVRGRARAMGVTL